MWDGEEGRESQKVGESVSSHTTKFLFSGSSKERKPWFQFFKTFLVLPTCEVLKHKIGVLSTDFVVACQSRNTDSFSDCPISINSGKKTLKYSLNFVIISSQNLSKELKLHMRRWLFCCSFFQYYPWRCCLSTTCSSTPMKSVFMFCFDCLKCLL